MKAAYVGILTPGTTSRMRAEVLKSLTPGWEWQWVDTHPPYLQAARWAKTLSFRFKIGPVIARTNALIQQSIQESQDLVWVDKAANFSVATIQALRQRAGCLVHFTPDTAFHTNKSSQFNRSLELYDRAITTKSFEAGEYARWLPAERLILTTQGYDANLHFPRHKPEEKQPEAVFIGLCEPDRERCMEKLLGAGVAVRVAGVNWESFARRHAAEPNFHYEGSAVFGEDYARMLSRAWLGLGLISRVFPELHTTRTFEIPACGTVLATEVNQETRQFFRPDEALFFEDYDELAERARTLLEQPTWLAQIAAAGRQRVQADGRDYRSILRQLLSQIGCPAPDEA